MAVLPLCWRRQTWPVTSSCGTLAIGSSIGPLPPRRASGVRRGRMESAGSRNDASTHGEPDEEWQGEDEAGHAITVACWRGLHLRTARGIELPLIRVIRPSPTATAR